MKLPNGQAAQREQIIQKLEAYSVTTPDVDR